MQAVVDWLNYTPKDFSSIAPHILNTADPPSRKGRGEFRVPCSSAVLYPIALPALRHLLAARPCTTVPLLSHSLSVEFTPSKTPYDPRHMLGGATLPDGSYVSGFFDKGTFKEYLGASRPSLHLSVSTLLSSLQLRLQQFSLFTR
jgi:hypothetical protein